LGGTIPLNLIQSAHHKVAFKAAHDFKCKLGLTFFMSETDYFGVN